MSPVIRKILACGVIFLSVRVADAREWVIDGKIKVEAEFGGVIGDTVFLHKADGSQVKCALSSLSTGDQAFIKEQQQGSVSIVAASPPPAPVARKPYSPIAEMLWNRLVVPGETGFADYTLTNPPDYIALYFSAGWCGPCHRFTPRLVDFYRQMKPRHGNFEVVFVSDDRNERDMFDYMRELSMPWPALRFAEIKQMQDIKKYCGPGIPCLVVIDPQGNVIADSYVNGQYVGPDQPMNHLKRLLELSSP